MSQIPKTGQETQGVTGAAQNALLCWSRAWSQLADGMMGAASAQIDWAGAWLRPPADPGLLEIRDPHAAALEWVRASEARFGEGVRAMRRVNDHLSAAWFGAAGTLADGIEASPEKGGRG